MCVVYAYACVHVCGVCIRHVYMCVVYALGMCTCVWCMLTHVYTGADPEGGFGDLSPLNFLGVKII